MAIILTWVLFCSTCAELLLDQENRRISVHLAPIPQPPTRDDIVASQKSRFEDQDKTIDYIVA
jgi:hypothetical protein